MIWVKWVIWFFSGDLVRNNLVLVLDYRPTEQRTRTRFQVGWGSWIGIDLVRKAGNCSGREKLVGTCVGDGFSFAEWVVLLLSYLFLAQDDGNYPGVC